MSQNQRPPEIRREIFEIRPAASKGLGQMDAGPPPPLIVAEWQAEAATRVHLPELEQFGLFVRQDATDRFLIVEWAPGCTPQVEAAQGRTQAVPGGIALSVLEGERIDLVLGDGTRLGFEGADHRIRGSLTWSSTVTPTLDASRAEAWSEALRFRDPALSDHMLDLVGRWGGLIGPVAAMGAGLRYGPDDDERALARALFAGQPIAIVEPEAVAWTRQLPAETLDEIEADALALARAWGREADEVLEDAADPTHVLESRDAFEGVAILLARAGRSTLEQVLAEEDALVSAGLMRGRQSGSEILDRARSLDPEAWWASTDEQS